MNDAIAETLQLEYTFHKHMREDLYHVPITRIQLTQHIPQLMDSVIEELEASFADEIGECDGILLIWRN